MCGRHQCEPCALGAIELTMSITRSVPECGLVVRDEQQGFLILPADARKIARTRCVLASTLAQVVARINGGLLPSASNGTRCCSPRESCAGLCATLGEAQSARKSAARRRCGVGERRREHHCQPSRSRPR